MRIVIDTNVLISGLLWHGAPHVLLNHVRGAKVELVTSSALLDELAIVLQRTKFSSILTRASLSCAGILNELQVLADVVVAPSLALPVCRDPDDDAVLACALAARASMIISGDQDLLVLKKFQQIPIVTAAQAIQLLDAQK